MKSVLLLANIIISIIIVILILIQGRGGGLGSAWGGSGAEFQTRRGFEKFTLQATYALLVLFLVVSVVNLFIH